MPDIDGDTLARADEIEGRKAQMREAVERCLAEEAALYMELYHSQRWTRGQMSDAAVKAMGWDVVRYLPERLPPQRRKRA